MAKDVIITPASGKLDFYGTTGGSVLANINLTDNNDLSLSTTSGNLIIGDASRDVYIGDGTNEVDIVFEQNGEIRSVAGKHITVNAGVVNATGVAVNTSSPNAVMHVYGSTPSGIVLNVEGTNGSLFSVVDNLDGTLMSVNNNAGLPVFEVFSDDSIIGGRFGQNDFVISTSGNVGIGVSNPEYKLAVSGAITVDNFKLDGNTISTTNTNGGLILNPNGTGGLQRDSGGNARGQYAVDWQTVRSTGTMVANGSYSVIGGGSNNTSSGNSSTVGGGRTNTSNGSYSTVGGGQGNTSSGYQSTVGGGTYNTSSGYNSAVGGGRLNTSSGTNSTVGGGQGNTSSGFNSTVAGGYGNTSSGDDSTVGGGNGNDSSGLYSTVGGGFENINSGSYSTIPGGAEAKASRRGELSHSAGFFDNYGDAQHTILIARRLTTNATANQVLFLDGSSALLIPPEQAMWTFEIKLSAYSDNADGVGAWWIFRGGILRDNAPTIRLVGSVITESGADSALSSAAASVVADTSNDALEIRVTGVAGMNIRWVAVVDISQVSFGPT